MAARLAGTAVRLLRHQLRVAGRARRGSVAAAAKARRSGRHVASLRRRPVPDAGRPRQADLRGLGAVPGAAERRLSVRAEYRADGRALAHAHEDPRSADSGAAVAARVAGDESARREAARAAQPRFGRRRLAPRPRARRRTAAHRDHGAGPGVHAVSFRRNQRERGDARAPSIPFRASRTTSNARCGWSAREPDA